MREPKVSVWIFMPTSDLFLVEELKEGYRVSFGDHLEDLFNLDHDEFMRLSVCLGEL